MGDSPLARNDHPSALVAQAITKIQRLATIVTDFRDDDGVSQRVLNANLYVPSQHWMFISTSNEYIALLAQLEDASQHLDPSRFPPIPLSLIRLVDEGGHPDKWLKDRLGELERENIRAHEKTHAISSFRQQLQQRLGASPSAPAEESASARAKNSNHQHHPHHHHLEQENEDSIIEIS